MFYHWLNWQIEASINSKVLVVGCERKPLQPLLSVFINAYPVSTVKYSNIPMPNDWWCAGKSKKEHNWEKKQYFGRVKS